MIWDLIPFGVALLLCWPVIALGQVYDAARASERLGARRPATPAVVYATTTQFRPITRTQADALRQQYTDLVAAERQRRSPIRKATRIAGIVAASALAGICSIGMAEGYHWSTWTTWTVSLLITVACLIAGAVVLGRHRG